MLVGRGKKVRNVCVDDMPLCVNVRCALFSHAPPDDVPLHIIKAMMTCLCRGWFTHKGTSSCSLYDYIMFTHVHIIGITLATATTTSASTT